MIGLPEFPLSKRGTFMVGFGYVPVKSPPALPEGAEVLAASAVSA